MANFLSITGKSIEDAKKESSFDIRRESLITNQSSMGMRKDALIRQVRDISGNLSDKIIGTVPSGRSIIPYPETISWLDREFSRTGIQFKLKSSDIYGSQSDMYQEYVFDAGLETPDHQDVYPMAIVRASMIDSPLKITFGAYRFVCKNGMMVGRTFSDLKINARGVESLQKSQIGDSFSATITNMKRVSERYQSLASESWINYFAMLINNKNLPLEVKKSCMYDLQSSGVVTINPQMKEGKMVDPRMSYEDFLGMRFSDDKSSVLGEKGECLISLNKEISAYDLYNYETDVCTHNVLNISSKTYGYMHISRMFDV